MYENNAGQQILTHIVETRRSVQRVFVLRAAIVMVCVSAILFLGVRAISLAIGSALSIEISAGISLLISGVVAGFYLRQQWQIAQDNAWLSALWRQSRDPSISELIRSALELNEALSDAETSDTTKQLIQTQLQNVWSRLSDIPPTECVPSVWNQVLRRSSTVVGVVMVGSLWFGDALFKDATTNAVVDEIPSSWVKGLTLSVEPPSYTGSKTRQFENTNGTINVLSGSVVTGTATADSRESKFVLILPDQSETEVTNQGGELSFNFTASQSGPWFFAKRKNNEEEYVKETGVRTLTVLPDKPPVVELLKPEQDRTVSESDLIQLVYRARDDFGLVKSRMVVALDGDLAQAERSELDPLQGKKARGAAELDLSLFDVQAGDRIAVHIECLDQKPPSGQVGRSKALYLTIESAEDDHRKLAADLKTLLEPFLMDLADRLELDPKSRTIVQIKAIHERTLTNTTTANDLLARLANDPLTPTEVTAVLKNKFKDLIRWVNAEESTLTAARKDNAKVISVMASMPKFVESLEHFIIAIESATARLALEDMQALTRQIQQRKERIRDLLEAYKESPNENLKNRILRNVKRLKQKMAELRERMAQLQQKLPEEFLNLDGLKGSKLSENMKDSAKSLDDLESMLEEGRIEDAMKALDELSESLNTFDDLVSEDMETLHQESDPERQRAISEMMDRTKDLINAQKELMKETKRSKEQGDQAFKDEMENKARAELDKIAMDLVEAEKEIAELKQESTQGYRATRLEKLAEETSKALESLEQQKYFRSEKHLEKSVETSRQLTWDRASKNHERDKAVNRKLRDAQDSLRKLLKNAKKAKAQAQNIQDIESQAKRQAKLRESLDQLGKEMREKGKEVPGIDGKPSQSVQEAGSAMGKAQESLQNYSPGQAQPSQTEAMNALQQTLQNLRQAAKPKPAKRDGQGRTREEKVEIPDGDDYEAPSAFREELLKAMKGKTAEPNEEAVKRYYRTLVE